VNYLLSANAAEVGVVLGAMMAGLPLPLLPLHILWINLMTDSWPALALGVDKAEGDVMRQRPRHPGESIFKGLKGFFVLTGLLGTAVVLGVFVWAKSAFGIDQARTMAMSTMILFELFRAYSCKNTRPFAPLFTNFWLNVAVMVSLGLQLVIMYTPLRFLFDLVPLGWDSWWKIILLSSSGFFVLELWKVLLAQKERREMVL
jgi:Ca2+-transporting ATPase